MALQVFGASSMPGLTQGLASIGDAFSNGIKEGLALKDLEQIIDSGKLGAQQGSANLGAANAGPATPVTPVLSYQGGQGVASGAEGASPFAGMDRRLEDQYQLPAGYLSTTARIESQDNPRAKNPNSSASGRFQFIDSTAKQYGLADPFDPVASTEAAAKLAADNRDYLRSVLNREPTAQELYLAHQQGAGGAAKILTNPNARAADLVGSQAIALNSGNGGMTAADFGNQWLSKYDAAAGGGGAAQAADAMAGGAGAPQKTMGQQLDEQAYGAPPASGQFQPVTNSTLMGWAQDPNTRQTANEVWNGQKAGNVYAVQNGVPVQVGAPIDNETLKALIRNPISRNVGLAIYQSRLSPSQKEYSFMQTGDGSIVRTSKDGTFEVVVKGPGKDNRTAGQNDYEYAVAQGFKGTYQDWKEWEAKNSRPSTTVNVDAGIKPPNGYMFADPANPAAGVKPIPGGPAEALPAELAARIGLADSFLAQLPAIREKVAADDVTGVYDRFLAGNFQRSSQAGIYRQIQSGVDALMRMLTGAGMNQMEAAQYAQRYLPSYTDDANSAASKLDQLGRELTAAKESALRGRGGSQTQSPQPQQWRNDAFAEGALQAARSAVEQGADRAAVEQRLREHGVDPGRL